MERNPTKTGKTTISESHDHEYSFRSNRALSHYNINDYLPPTFNSISRPSLLLANEKTYTEPNDRNGGDVSEFRRMMEKNEEEKQHLKREIEKLLKKT
uniref:Predicted protein n=1 Tax=Hordeum vulgare subsp. vulgare TaxID=112509 RepID=F2DZT0_HORVV|nr:predicted protein [Hordeum vulgare subsp. vulgare]